MNHRVRVILFDLGNVILPVDFDRTVRHWSAAPGVPKDKIRDTLLLDDPVYYAFERGAISAREFRQSIERLLRCRIPVKVFDEGWNAMLEGVTAGAGEILDRLGTNFRLAVLSNTNTIHARFFRRRHAGLFRKFDRIFLSHEIRCRKPDPCAFRTVLDHYGISPEEMVFLDDRETMVSGARELGIRASVVSSPTAESIREALAQWNIPA